MIDGWIIVALSFLYIGALFCVAYWGDRARTETILLAGRPYVYALALGVYCTSWTFFGSVGSASQKGLDFIAVYLGPIAAFALAAPLLRRIDLADQDAKHHLDCRFHRRALRQEPRRGRNRDRRRGCGAPAVHRLAAQGGLPVD